MRVLFIIAILLIPTFCFSGEVTTLTLLEKEGVTTSNYPLTFGHVFKDGDVSQYIAVRYNGTILSTQCNVKTTYASRDVRFAVISVVLPLVASGSTNTITLETSANANNSGELSKTEILATKVASEIRLTNVSGSGYSGNLTASLSNSIAADRYSYWLSGSVMSEIIVNQSLNNSLEAEWEVRFYPGTAFGPRISHSIENMNAEYRGIVIADVNILDGLPTLSSKYTQPQAVHTNNARWRKVFWAGPEPPETELHYNLKYLISTGAILNYDTSIKVPEADIASTYSHYLSADKTINGGVLLNKSWPTTGAREEIAPLPAWTVRYLLTFDNRLKKATLAAADSASSAPFHYKEGDKNRASYGKPITIDDRPTVWTDSGEFHRTFGLVADRLPEPIGSEDVATHGWTIDRAHQGSFSYVPYLISGEKFYLEEMYYLAAWDLSMGSYSSTISQFGKWGRDFSHGYIVDQARGDAWAFRNIVDAAAFAVDGDTEGPYLKDKIANNIAWWSAGRMNFPLHNWTVDTGSDGRILQSQLNEAEIKYITAPWMEDFMMISLGHAKEQGFDTTAIISWFDDFLLGRMSNPDFNHYRSVNYHFPIYKETKTFVKTWAEANSLYVDPVQTSMATEDVNYLRYASAALTFITNTSEGVADWKWFESAAAPYLNHKSLPYFAILPRNIPVIFKMK